MLKRILPILMFFVILLIIGCYNDVEKSVNPPYTDNEFFPSFVNINYELDGVLNLSGIQDVHPAFSAVFDKYTNVTAPNGKQIHLVGQSDVSRTKMARARSIMQFYLTDYDNGQFGGNKGLIANAMADTGAVLLYFNTFADMEIAMAGALGELNISGQDLYSDESVVEGDYDYLNNTIRDATFEEIFHLVHTYGIEIVLPEYNNMINDAMEYAYENGIWTPDQETYDEWAAEGSLGKEYIISVIDVYYGLWAHEDGPSFYGEYLPNDRESLYISDPHGYDAVKAFLPTYFTNEFYLDESFEGTFSLGGYAVFFYNDEAIFGNGIYFHKSQYIKDITLTGTNNTNVIGNRLGNVFTVNSGRNIFVGGDYRDIQADYDTVKFLGAFEEYVLEYIWEWNNDRIISDNVENRSGINITSEIDVLMFNGVAHNLVLIQ
jgi:hypothetical protein